MLVSDHKVGKWRNGYCLLYNCPFCCWQTLGSCFQLRAISGCCVNILCPLGNVWMHFLLSISVPKRKMAGSLGLHVFTVTLLPNSLQSCTCASCCPQQWCTRFLPCQSVGEAGSESPCLRWSWTPVRIQISTWTVAGILLFSVLNLLPASAESPPPFLMTCTSLWMSVPGWLCVLEIPSLRFDFDFWTSPSMNWAS